MVTVWEYTPGDVFLSMLWFFLFFIWIMILFQVFIDIFRSKDLGGGAKALWVIFVIILPFLGIFVYLIARGKSMAERRMGEAIDQKKAMDAYVRETAGSSVSSADEIAKLAQLKDQGVLTDAEFNAQKAKLLGAG